MVGLLKTKCLDNKNTVVCLSESKWPELWSKWPGILHCKISPCSGCLGSTLLLTGALEWGTVWTSTSTDTGVKKGQS